ncbi:MAG: lipopolysaccharide biosynthesis protein [Burkholderiaceae bacterium]
MIRHASTLFTGTLFGQLLPLAVAPLITRFVSPAEFGIFALLLTLVGLGSYACGGRYEAAIVVPADDAEASSLLRLVLAINAVFFGITLTGLAAALILAPAHEMFGPVWLSLPFMILANGLINAWEGWGNRHEAYRGIAVSRTTRGIGVALCQIGLLAASVPPLLALVIGQCLGMLSGFLAGTSRNQSFFAALALPWTYRDLRDVAGKYAHYPRYNTIHGLIHAAQAPLTLVIISAYCTPLWVGAFGLVQRILQAPSGLVGTAVAPVLLRELVKPADAHTRQRTVLRVIAGLSIVAAPLFIVVAVWAPELFGRIFGESWHDAGVLAQNYWGYLLLSFVAAPLAVVSQAARRMDTAMVVSIIGNALYLGTLWATLTYDGSLPQSLRWLSIVMAIYFVLYLAWLVRIARFDTHRD